VYFEIKSNINNSMKNIKGYYSWIHSLNSAANKVQETQQTLNEAMKGGSQVGDYGGRSTRIRGTTTTSAGSGEESQESKIAQGLYNLIQTINTGRSPEAKVSSKSPNPTLKPSEQIRVTPQGVSNIGKEARATSFLERGRGETIFGDESYESIPGGENEGAGPATTPEQIAIYKKLRAEKEAERVGRLSPTTKAPDLKVSDRNDDGDSDVSDVLTTNQHIHSKNIGHPNFTDPFAAQARIDSGNPIEGDDELVHKAASGEIPARGIGSSLKVQATPDAGAEMQSTGTKELGSEIPAKTSVPKLSRKSIKPKTLKDLPTDAEGRTTLGGGAKIRVVTLPKTTQPANESVSAKISKFLGN
jgi:hypothetical protein